MKLKIITKLQKSRKIVVDGFNQTLFDTLSPPFPPVKVTRYDGSKTGDIVELELNFFIFKQKWISTIIDHGANEKETWFVDKGTTLPFFLTGWHHKHIIQETPTGSSIIDDIEYKSYPILEWVLFPVLYLQFLYRIPIYKSYFK
tara:strand:- start:54 stop:485 length:432 start_codon:yes stop_codon:yes gene_type:complete